MNAWHENKTPPRPITSLELGNWPLIVVRLILVAALAPWATSHPLTFPPSRPSLRHNLTWIRSGPTSTWQIKRTRQSHLRIFPLPMTMAQRAVAIAFTHVALVATNTIRRNKLQMGTIGPSSRWGRKILNRDCPLLLAKGSLLGHTSGTPYHREIFLRRMKANRWKLRTISPTRMVN